MTEAESARLQVSRDVDDENDDEPDQETHKILKQWLWLPHPHNSRQSLLSTREKKHSFVEKKVQSEHRIIIIENLSSSLTFVFKRETDP